MSANPPQTPPGAELRRVRSLIADLEAVVWELDAPSVTFGFVSEGLETLFGWSPRDWLEDPTFWVERLHPEDRDRVLAQVARVATEGGRLDEEFRLATRDGPWAWVRAIGHAVPDVEGRPASVRGLIVEITEHKLVEAERLEAEERFRRLVERLPGIVYLLAPSADEAVPGTLLYVSPQVEPLLGFRPEAWVADPVAWARQLHPDDRASYRRALERARRTREPFRAEYRMYTREGAVRWFRDEAVPILDERGEPVCWQGVMLDVSAEHESAERARQTEGLYRMLVNQLPAIVYSEDVRGSGLQLIFVNRQVEALLGVTPEEWIADPTVWERLMHPDDREAVLAENARTERTGEPFRAEYRMIARDGRVLWFADEAVLVRDDQGEPRYWQGVMIDITARKHAEAALAEAEARYRALVEQNPTITYLDPIEPGRPTLYISPQTTTILGYTPEDWYADPDLWSKIAHPEDRARLEAQPAEPGRHAAVYRLIARDGREVWVHDQARLITDEHGTPRYWQGVLVDVTEQRRAEQLEHDLAREREEAERLRAEDEMRSTVLQAVAHDLRTPLAAILGLARTLERADLDLAPEEARDLAGRIAANARRLDRLVGDLLDLERLQLGAAVPALEPVDLGRLVRDVLGRTEGLADREVATELAPVVVEADPAMLERIVENLLANAVKHTPPQARVWVRTGATDTGALLVVEDEGPGVAPEARERIFEPFRQAPGAAPGTGVGLALVRRFAELHGGRAWVEERPGGGASFRVALPSSANAQG
jgi:PAS domain S-box-containing protein